MIDELTWDWPREQAKTESVIYRRLPHTVVDHCSCESISTLKICFTVYLPYPWENRSVLVKFSRLKHIQHMVATIWWNELQCYSSVLESIFLDIFRQLAVGFAQSYVESQLKKSVIVHRYINVSDHWVPPSAQPYSDQVITEWHRGVMAVASFFMLEFCAELLWYVRG